MDDAAAASREVGESVVTRWQQNDVSTQAIIELTRTLTRLTWVLVLVALATLAVAVIALVQG